MLENRELVHVVTTIESGGAENALLLLASKQVNSFRQVKVFPLKGKPELLSELSRNGVMVDLSLLNRSFIKQIFIFRRYPSDSRIFHAHLPRAELLLFFTKRSKKFFVTRHNSENFFPKLSRFFSSTLSKLILKNTFGVIAISKAVQEFLRSQGELSNVSPCTVIHYGYTPRGPFLEKNSIRPTMTKHETLRLVSISRLAAQKNIPLMFDFIELLEKKGISANLDIVGEGPQQSFLQRNMPHLNRNQIHFLGKKNGIVELLTNYDYFILTSKYEGFGLVLLEAMDAGLPIVAPRNSAIPEVMGSNHPGLYNSGNLLSMFTTFINLHESLDTAREAFALQKQQLYNFSSQTYLEKHLELYEAQVNFE